MAGSEAASVADLVRRVAREDPERPFLDFEDASWTRGEYLARCLRIANLLRARLAMDAPGGPAAPPHVGVLMENRPEYLDLLGGAALAGAVLVGINGTRRGAELERDVRHTDCRLLIADDASLPLLEGLDVPDPLVVGTEYEAALSEARDADGRWPVSENDLYLLIFTSGTTGAPKAVKCSHRRMIATGGMIADIVGLTAEDCAYLAMPMFHANPLMCGFLPALLSGARLALARRFSVRGFLPDVRRYGATYFPYSGKPLSFLVSAPGESPADAETPLRVAYGNEGSWRMIQRFEARYGCRVIDGFGPTEGGMGFVRRSEDPPGSVGRPPPAIRILREDGEPCPPARFDADGRLLNAEECVGEIVNTEGAGRFEGYYRHPEAEARRVRDGMYWSGDLGYQDAAGFLYFAGRTDDWIRVDGENFPPRPIEELVERHPGVLACAAYGVPDEAAGDRLMIAVEPAPGGDLDPDDLYRHLVSQPDLSPKWLPTYVLVSRALPRGPTGKVLVRTLRRAMFFLDRAPGTIYRRERGDEGFRAFTLGDAEWLVEAFTANGRRHLLDV